MLKRFFDFVVRRKRWMALLWVVVVVATLPAVARVGRDFSVEAYFPKDDPKRASYERFAALFPGEDATVVAFVDVAQQRVTARDIALLRDVERSFTSAGVRDVRHLGNV